MAGKSDSESSSDSTSTSSETSSSSSEAECQPAPAKKVKKSQKKKMAPQKKLAKKAAKKGDRKSEKSILELANEAMRIESEKVGQEMETELIRLDGLLEDWKNKDVEEENVQRFAAKFLNKLKKFDILCSVDTAIFKNEIGRVRLLDMDISPINSQAALNRQELKDRSDSLLKLVVDAQGNHLDQTREGTSWNVREFEQRSENKQEEG